MSPFELSQTLPLRPSDALDNLLPAINISTMIDTI
jgi:hypothetical protein